MSLLDIQECDLTSAAFDPSIALKHGAHGTRWLEKVSPFDHLGQVKSILEDPLCPLVREPREKSKTLETQPHQKARTQGGFFETIKATLGTPLQALQFSKKNIVRVLLRDTHYLYGVAIGRLQAIDRHWNTLLFDVQLKLIDYNSDTVWAEFYSKSCPSSLTYDSLIIRGENVVSVCYQCRSN
ncbi:hypothetical protein Gasu2_02220 [Galdieria sulphuraria]|uniref:Sm domain-containing protein n=1 Tax=Galdieria sulphuraria TaxID=130081 RepID=M2XCY1_GALSU|nr:uncharacterized protein Gasu_46360 [Galdieria sulphuraria]EME27812.1 hypothetical protein Gasu_46360 [Galdieria sulphuraria]GJD05770.1 hypothetical protein Gasu2_02220 [Galdieria sulphuraria]|eukprot:XP_005704332.1 hypothetical protein Gasu_46360 [Galdieria sulphuraria]